MGCCYKCKNDDNDIHSKNIDKENKKNENVQDKNNNENQLIESIINSISDQDESNDINSSDSNNSEKEYFKEIVKKNRIFFNFAFGNDFENRYMKFLKAYNKLFDFSTFLKTTLYTFSFEKVKDIIEYFNKNKVKDFIISDNFYNKIINTTWYKRFKNLIDTCDDNDVYELFSEIVEIQFEIILSMLKIFQINKEFNIINLSYSFIKCFQDIGFCIKFFYYLLYQLLYQEEFLGFEYHLDIRIHYFIESSASLMAKTEIPSNLLQIATESSRINDTIILGDEQFKIHIKELKLSCQRINDLDDNKLDEFFKNPFEENDYRVFKYFVICDEDSEKKYLEEFEKLSAKYGFAYLFIVYLKNKKLSDLRFNLNEEKSCLYVLGDDELFEIFLDNNERLKPNLFKFLPKNDPFSKELNELNNIIHNDIKNFKSTCEDGWELFMYKEKNIKFKFNLIFCSFHNFIDKVLGNFYQSYKEHNSLEIFFKYYSNYLFLTLQPQLIINMTAYVKMIIYAYSLELNDANKNLYCILNDDLRSSIPEKVDRFLDLIKLIGGLIKTKNLKSFNGKLYRASFLKDELINEIKIGQTMTNSAFWSSTKKESVAKDFLSQYYKNTLIITNGGLYNNVDIHLEGISKYPYEEEVLFLPFCLFTIKNFSKVQEGNLNYYKLELENNSDSSMIEPYSNEIIERLNGKRMGF